MNHSILTEHAKRLQDFSLKDIAEKRLDNSTLSVAGWKINIARHKIDLKAEQALVQFGKAIDLESSIHSLFNGDVVNSSEGRPALHWALRCKDPSFAAAKQVRETLKAPFQFAEAVRDGRILTPNGKRYEAVIHIGIGGSDLGPRLLYDTFYKERDRRFKLRFCANLDPLDFDLAVDGLNPETTLVVGVSKSFQTEETLYNLNRVREWLVSSLTDEWSNNVAIVTSKQNLADQWLERSNGNIFDIPESVGGRYSIWSAGTLSCFIALGTELIQEVLDGANLADQHIRHESIESNAAMRLALVDYWNASVMNFPMRVELAYSRRLRLLPSYLQQLEMESNGKSVTTNGEKIDTPTAPAVWGSEGTNGQHSFHQWLHQSPQKVSSEFVLALEPDVDIDGKTRLVANALAQAEVLAEGNTLEQFYVHNNQLSTQLAKQKELSGEKPSTFIMTNQFTPRKFGSLIALFEQRTYLAGQLWRLNSFDQWGVEQGKQIAAQLRPIVAKTKTTNNTVSKHLVESSFCA